MAMYLTNTGAILDDDDLESMGITDTSKMVIVQPLATRLENKMGALAPEWLKRIYGLRIFMTTHHNQDYWYAE